MRRSTGRPRFSRPARHAAPRPSGAPIPRPPQPIEQTPSGPDSRGYPGPRTSTGGFRPSERATAALPHERVATVVREIVVRQRAKPRWGLLATGARVLLGLQILGGISGALWPTTDSRMVVADYIASSICTSSHPPRECQPGVPASSLFGDFLSWVHGGGPG